MRSMKMGAALAALALGATLAIAGCSSTTVTGSGPAPDTVTSIGAGTGTAAPDTAQLSLGVNATGKDRAAAQDAASKTSAAIIAAVKATGVDAKDIQTGQISLNQRYDSRGRTTPAYDAFQSIEVKTKLVDKVGAIVSAATDAGATNVSGPQFSISDSNAARVDAIDKAMADAKVRATAIAKASGRVLGRVVSVTESDVDQVGPLYDLSRSAAGKSVEVPVEAGQVETQVRLTVIFALE